MLRASQFVAVSFVSAVFANDAAPLSATHVVEEIAAMLQPHLHGSGASVSKLRKTFHGVHLSTQLAEDEATPGAADALNKALTGVIAQISEKVDSKIIQDHGETNSEIGRRVKKLVEKTTDSVSRMANAKTNDKTWLDCVGNERAALVASENATKALADEKQTYGSIFKVAKKARKFVFTPSQRPIYQCQLSSDRTCTGALSRFTKEINDIIESGTSMSKKADGAWKIAEANWKNSKGRVKDAISAEGVARGAWEKQRDSCDDLVEARQSSMCLFGLKLQEKCGKLADYKVLLDDVEQVDGGVYSHPDRESQWKATHIVKCMLQNVISGAPLNSESMNACAETVDFGSDVGVLDLKKKEVESATTPDNFSCNEKEIAFSGFTWNIPSMEDATSAGYTRQDVAYGLTLAKGHAPFAFCNTEKESCASHSCTRGKPKNRNHICQGQCTDAECC